ncbi:hypothetical protein XENOCAPTIV_005031 [Xenoophorus captivus]|uniref:Uncharacterized protein n=1 Tax=Xenoophorus captivus TaxID=1517983 RepID=A0ABV0QMJ8_9TELE
MAALQLMQQKANKDSNKTDMPAITESSEAPTDGKADTTQTTAAEVSTDSTGPVDNSAPTAPQVATESEENSSKPTTNGPVDPAGTQNGERKSPLEGKELEESIPGLAQAKELAETLVSEDGSGVRFPEDALEDIQKQKQLLKDAAAFLVTCQVPSLVTPQQGPRRRRQHGMGQPDAQRAILLKEYNFDSRHKPAFTEEDILNIFPVVKHVNPKASDAFHFFQSGQAKVQQGFLKEGCELINEALNLFNNVYGAMHVEICACLRLLARLNYIMGDHPESNIGLVLHGVMEYDLSLRFLENALTINTKYHGAQYLKYLTQQAVALQRTMNEIYKNGSNASIMPLKFTAPSMASILEQLNIINGIIFIPLR